MLLCRSTKIKFCFAAIHCSFTAQHINHFWLTRREGNSACLQLAGPLQGCLGSTPITPAYSQTNLLCQSERWTPDPWCSCATAWLGLVRTRLGSSLLVPQNKMDPVDVEMIGFHQGRFLNSEAAARIDMRTAIWGDAKRPGHSQGLPILKSFIYPGESRRQKWYTLTARVL